MNKEVRTGEVYIYFKGIMVQEKMIASLLYFLYEIEMLLF
jgi:hypothetical protein